MPGSRRRRIVATGGGTQAPAWMQALADCTSLPVDVVAVPEGGALGSAFIARCIAGLETSMTDAAAGPAYRDDRTRPRLGRGRSRSATRLPRASRPQAL